MSFTIINTTANTIGPYNGVTIGPNLTYFVSEPVAGFARDTQLQSDALNNIVNIQLGDTVFGSLNAFNLLFQLTSESSINVGQNPNLEYVNARAQGPHTANSSVTPLNANTTFRGTWFAWQEGYVKLVADIFADVPGTLYIDFSQKENPVNGTDADKEAEVVLDYNNVNTILKRTINLQSKWVRARYINGNAAQSIFELQVVFLTADSGYSTSDANVLPNNQTQVGLVRSIATIRDSGGNNFVDVPVAPNGAPKTYVTHIEDDVLIEPLNSGLAGQIIVGTTPTRIDPTQIANRRAIRFSNEGPGRIAWGHSSGITFNTSSIRMKVNKTEHILADDSMQFWAVAEDLGGAQTLLTRSPSSASGTATNPTNVLSSDNIYANITANTQNITAAGFTAGTINPLVSVKIGIEGNKQSGQTETVSITEVATGSTTGAGSVSTTSLVGGTNKLYVAIISRNASTGTVNSVTGGGISLAPTSQVNITSGNRRIDVWYGYGNFAAGAVTANLSTSTNAHIAVYNISNASSTTPIESINSTTGTGTTVTGPGINGTNKGLSILAVSHTAASGTAGAGYTENSDQTNGTGSNVDSLATENKPLTVTGLETATYTLVGSSAWAAIGLTVLPKVANDPVTRLSYTLSGNPGATFGDITFSSATDANSTVDITSDRSWQLTDIPNLNVIATGQSISAAAANIDYMYLELTDSTGNTSRVSVWQGGKAVS